MVFAIGPYQILKSLGKGGIGEVFLAYDPKNDRQIALKRLLPELESNVQKRGQFLNEALILKRLKHPCILPIYSTTEDQEGVYYTMPLIEGESLDKILVKARELPPESIAYAPIFLQICQALAYAHAQGIIHRDLKPSNILVDKTGRIWVSDWGLGIFLTEPALEKVNSIPGTIPYLSPELALGQPPSRQSDIYALGLILYEMLTLRYPFHRGSMAEYYQHMHSEALPDPISIVPNRQISPVFSQIALKALAYIPQDRYHSVDEILFDLEKQSPTTTKEEPLIGKAVLQPLYFTDWLEQPEYIEEFKQIQRAFLASDIPKLEEIFLCALKVNPSPLSIIESVLIALIELGQYTLATQKIEVLSQEFLDIQAIVRLSWIHEAIKIHLSDKIEIAFLHELPKKLTMAHLRPLYHILHEALRRHEADLVIQIIKILFDKHEIRSYHQQKLAFLLISAYLLNHQWEDVEKIISWLKHNKI